MRHMSVVKLPGISIRWLISILVFIIFWLLVLCILGTYDRRKMYPTCIFSMKGSLVQPRKKKPSRNDIDLGINFRRRNNTADRLCQIIAKRSTDFTYSFWGARVISKDVSWRERTKLYAYPSSKIWTSKLVQHTLMHPSKRFIAAEKPWHNLSSIAGRIAMKIHVLVKIDLQKNKLIFSSQIYLDNPINGGYHSL